VTLLSSRYGIPPLFSFRRSSFPPGPLRLIFCPLSLYAPLNYPPSTLTFVYLGEVVTKKQTRLIDSSTQAILLIQS
jgi:hypothetical protein